MNGPEFATRLKKDVLGGYVRFLESLDPELATHILSAQKEAFLAGKKFLEDEAGHAERAIRKIRERNEAREQSEGEKPAQRDAPDTEASPRKTEE